MSKRPIDHNEDLLRLRNEGYNIAITEDGYVVIREVPYLNETGDVCSGAVVCPLEPSDHTVLFCGTYPHTHDRGPIETIRHSTVDIVIADDLRATFKFSNKPKDGYRDRHDMLTRYIEIIENHAKATDSSLTAKTFTVIEDSDEESVFRYIDTASSRAEITAVSHKLKDKKIAIIGLGGTGAYVLDLVSKTHIKEIHLFDDDAFSQHNAFRTPGAASLEDLGSKPKKVEYFAEMYAAMRHGIVPHTSLMTEQNCSDLNGFDFVFLCMDASEDKKAVVDFLIAQEILFIDTGIGLLEDEGALLGHMRITVSSEKVRTPITGRISYATPDPDALYATNIQVAEINALAASLAVIKWKKMFGLYVDRKQEHNITYMIEENALINEDVAENK